MGRVFGIWDVPPQTRMRLRLLSIALKVSMSELVTQLTDEAWERNADAMTIDKEVKRKVRRLLRKNPTPI